MATYTLTIDFNTITLPTSLISFVNYGGDIGSDNTAYNTASDAMQAIGAFYINEYSGTYTVTNVGDVYTITLDLTNDPVGEPNGNLVALILQDDNFSGFNYSWQYGAEPACDTIPCPTCQAVTIENCGPVTIALPLPDDDYLVHIVDNQTGVTYAQNVQWTAGTGTWNTTNTAGVFTPFSIYTLTVTEPDGTPVSWPVGPNEYTCARVIFSATVDTNSDG